MTPTLLSSRTDLLAASGDDPFVRYEAPYDLGGPLLGPAWAADGAVVFPRAPLPDGGRRLTALGDVRAAAELVATVADAAPPATLTVPRGALPLLPARLRSPRPDDWDWFWTDAAPPPQAGEERAGWLDGSPAVDEELRALLTSSSPRYSAEPGDADIVRWAGIRDASGALVACAAHTEHLPGVPHLASIASRLSARGRGLGRAVTAWTTRQLVAEAGVVTLGMYADNDAARAMYHRLGYRSEHRFTSGRLLASVWREGCCSG